MSAEPSDHLVHEAVGPSIGGRDAAATIGVGVNSLLVLGVLPVLLGSLVDEHRLTNAGIGQIASLELLAMAASTAACGAFLKAERLRLIGVACSVGLAIANLCTATASGVLLFPLRAVAGGIEGVLLWITVSMIARTVTPERWAGVFFAAQTFGQLVLALALAMWVMPRFGASGGYVALAVASLLGVAPAIFTPHRFAPLPLPPGEGGMPPFRGWLALLATVVFVAAGGRRGRHGEQLQGGDLTDAGVGQAMFVYERAQQHRQDPEDEQGIDADADGRRRRAAADRGPHGLVDEMIGRLDRHFHHPR